jgi:NAD(P)-dependent dehydrogenase (short-subunit alcohol dehydrogenase family)
MQLHGKSAVIYGANSPIGASVARAFAKEGATVYLAGRSTSRLQPVAREILNAGGAVEVAQVDPLDPKSVSEHLHQIVVKHGTVDLSLNLAFLGMEGAARLCNLTDEQFAAAMFTRVRSNFVTMAAAASEMAYQGRGVILATAAPERGSPEAKLAGQAIGSAAIEALCEQLHLDVGSFGVRIAYVGEVPASEGELLDRLDRALESDQASPRASAESTSEAARSTRPTRLESPAGAATG